MAKSPESLVLAARRGSPSVNSRDRLEEARAVIAAYDAVVAERAREGEIEIKI